MSYVDNRCVPYPAAPQVPHEVIEWQPAYAQRGERATTPELLGSLLLRHSSFGPVAPIVVNLRLKRRVGQPLIATSCDFFVILA
jgi:hypothetical protein